MKKNILMAAAVGFAALVMYSCASGGTNAASAKNAASASNAASTASTTIPLDQAIGEAAKDIEGNTAAGQIIAVLNFTSPTEQFSEYVLEELSDKLVNGRKLVVVDRKQLDLIRTEENFQMSGEVSDESMQSIGKKLGAQLIATGSINAIGNVYRFRVRTLAVESAAIPTSYTTDVNPAEARVASLFGGAKPAAAQAAPTQPPAPAPVVQPVALPVNPPVPVNFVRVEGGTFQMGSNNNEFEKPVHTVTVKSFYMGKYEVTQKEWIAVMGDNPSRFKGDNLPVEWVSWYDAIEYCIRWSEREGLTPAYTIDKSRKDWNNHSERDIFRFVVTWNRNANGYRLPTEAEWEYAARGGNGSPGNYAYAGSNNVDEVAWYYENSAGSTQEVGSKKPNGLGLYDMSGNVAEWCWDWYSTYTTRAQTDPVGASSGSYRVSRDGSWFHPAQYLLSAQRNGIDADFWNNHRGFRVARNAP